MKNNAKQSTTGAVRKLYQGVASCYVLAVNPDKAKYEELTGRTLESEPVYISTDDNGVRKARIMFLVKPNPRLYTDNDGNPIDTVIPVYFNLKECAVVGKNSGKTLIMDKYGRTAWATPEDVQAHRIPVYSTGEARIASDYFVPCQSESELTSFMKCYLNIDNVDLWKDRKIVGLIANPEQAECRLEHVNDYFGGDFSELQEAVSWQPFNEVKICFGVTTNQNGKLIQTTYNGRFLKNGNTSYDSLQSSIIEAKNNGGLSNAEFSVEDLHEYNVNVSTVEDNNADMPETEGVDTSNPWEI